MTGSSSCCSRKRAGTLKTASRPSSRASLHDGLARLHDFAGLGASGRHHAGGAGSKLREAEAIARQFDTAPRRPRGRLRRYSCACKAWSKRGRVVKPCAMSWSWRSKALRAVLDLAPRGRQGRLRGAEGVLFGLRVQPGNELPGRDPVADVHGTLHDAAADAERKRDVVLRLDLARELDIVRQLARLHRDDVDRSADVWRTAFQPDRMRPVRKG